MLSVNILQGVVEKWTRTEANYRNLRPAQAAPFGPSAMGADGLEGMLDLLTGNLSSISNHKNDFPCQTYVQGPLQRTVS